MKVNKFIPKLCTEWTEENGTKHEPVFKGCIMLKVPTFFERQKMRLILLNAITANGTTDIETVKTDGSKVSTLELMEKMVKLVEESIPFYQSVELENIATGAVHKSFDDLSLDKDAEPILQEVAQEIAHGFSLSKN